MKTDPSTHAFEHAARGLAFDAVLDLVASRCANAAARESVRGLRPCVDPDRIAVSLAEIEEYREFASEAGDVPVGGTDCREDVVALADPQRAVPTEALLAVSSAERAVGEARRMLRRESEGAPRLGAIAERMTPHDELVAAIERAIDADGSVKDDASRALRAIRRDIHGLRASLRSLSEKLVGDFGDESAATVMGSRYVVVVPRAKIRKGSGMVHATSHSGGSLYFEPFGLVDRNNELESRVSDERAEETRVVAELRARVREHEDEILANLDAMDELDAIRAKARFAETFRCTSPAFSETGRVRLVDARHPVLERLLADAEGGRELVPLTMTLDPERRTMVITGPNAGGKTVAIKTAGVAALLFQCGLPVPCGVGTELPVFRRVFVDIGDEQSLESSLSTFTSHLRHLGRMTRAADADALCLIDEIGDGTDPDEGAALAIATLEKLIGSGAAVIATTHYGRIKTFALQTDGVTNASMAFEDNENRPLYRLLQGVAGRSRGLETARLTGFDPDVVRRAESLVGEDAYRLESLLADLERELRRLESERATAAERRMELERLVKEYESKAEEYNMTRREATRKAAREAEGLLREARRETERIVRDIRETGADRRAIREGRERIGEMLEKTQRERRESEPAARKAGDVSAGDRVSVSPTGKPSGIVIEVEGSSATVEINGKRIKLSKESLYDAAPAPGGSQTDNVSYDFHVEPLVTTSLDVRGNDREDALAALARFLDQAVYTGVQQVTVIHGVGTGVLARAVRGYLADDRRVESARPGQQAEGGMGVTVVRLG